jgi:hypothetical protein
MTSVAGLATTASFYREDTMKVRVGERYRCSDSNCGCEIEITAPTAMQEDGDEDVVSSPNDRSIAGSVNTTDVGSLRQAEAAAISTAGDYGSQGATGEGVFGTSGGNQRSTASGRLGSMAPSNFKSSPSQTSDIVTGSTGEATFSCCCGQPMRKSSSYGQRSAGATA